MHGYRCFEIVRIFHYDDLSKTKSAVLHNVILMFLYKKQNKKETKKNNNPHLLKYALLKYCM